MAGRCSGYKIQADETIFFFFFQAALLSSLVNGKVFMEWVSPAVLKAYQWQVSNHKMKFLEFIKSSHGMLNLNRRFFF